MYQQRRLCLCAFKYSHIHLSIIDSDASQQYVEASPSVVLHVLQLLSYQPMEVCKIRFTFFFLILHHYYRILSFFCILLDNRYCFFGYYFIIHTGGYPHYHIITLSHYQVLSRVLDHYPDLPNKIIQMNNSRKSLRYAFL